MAKKNPTAAAAADQVERAGTPEEGIKVIARSAAGIRRAGRFWGPEAATVSLADLTPEQLDAIESEPQLITQRVDMPAAPAAASGTSAS